MTAGPRPAPERGGAAGARPVERRPCAAGAAAAEPAAEVAAGRAYRYARRSALRAASWPRPRPPRTAGRSGCRADRCAVAGAEGLDDLLEALDRQILVGVVADHHHRRVHAGAEALDLFPAQLAVGGDLERIVVDPVLADLDQFLRAAQHARGRAAHQDVGLRADRLQQELRVEGRDLEHADIGHAQHLGDRLDRGAGDPALLLLRAPQHRDHGRLPGGRRDTARSSFQPRPRCRS